MPKNPDSDTRFRPETLTAQALGFVDAETGAIVPPVHPSSTYARDEENRLLSGRLYSRADNPNYDLPEQLIAALEHGEDAMLYSSGNTAGAAVFQTLKPGNRVILSQVMYWALRGWILDWAGRWGVEIEIVDTTRTDLVAEALRKKPAQLVWVETPANPTLAITDIAACADLAHEAGAMLAVDSTFASPVLSQPLDLGADLVMHSATKYLNGHSDVIAGVVVTKKRNAFWEDMKRVRFQQGTVLGPFEAWLLLRGLRTLHIRVKAQSAGALALATHFSRHPAILEALYPGLPENPGHEVASRQMTGGFGGMLSLRVKGGAAAALEVVAKTRIWKRATSLGGVESLIEHRASVEGPDSPTPPDLLRLSTGIEAVEDLIEDLERGLHPR